MAYQGRAQEAMDLILEKFKNPESLPAPMANVFVVQPETHASGYSHMNRFLVALHGEPDAMGFNQWQEHGRHVVKGGKGFPILAPIVSGGGSREQKREDAGDTAADNASGNASSERKRGGFVRGFRSVIVFGHSQTDGEPYAPLLARPFVQDLPYREVADSWGLRLSTYNGASSKSLGYAQIAQQRIALGVENPQIFAHELMHVADARNGHLDVQRYATDRAHRQDAECVADLGAAILLTAAGKPELADLGGVHRYVRNWSPDGDPRMTAYRLLKRTMEGVDSIMQTAAAVQRGEAQPAATQPALVPVHQE
jgi:hypothetical protein